MPNPIEQLTGYEAPSGYLDQHKSEDWAESVYTSFTAQTTISLHDLFEALRQGHTIERVPDLLNEFLRRDPDGYPEVFQECWKYADAAMEFVADYTEVSVDFLVGAGLSTLPAGKDAGNGEESPAHRFWKIAYQCKGYGWGVYFSFWSRGCYPARRAAIFKLLLRPLIEFPPGKSSRYEFSKIGEVESVFLKEIRFEIYETGHLAQDVKDAIFGVSDPAIQDTDFPVSVLMSGLPCNFPEPLPALSPELAKIYLIKSIFGMSPSRKFEPIPDMEQRKIIFLGAIKACVAPAGMTAWIGPLLDADEVDLVGFWNHIKDTEPHASNLFLELILLRSLSGENFPSFSAEECMEWLRDGDIDFSCTFEVWNTLLQLNGESRSLLFLGFWDMVPLDRMVKKWLAWFEQLLLDKSFRFKDNSIDLGEFAQSILSNINRFPVDSQVPIMAVLLELPGSDPWSLLGKFLHVKDRDMGQAVINMLYARNSPSIEVIRSSVQSSEYWPLVIYFFYDYARNNDEGSVPFWASKFIKLAKNSWFHSTEPSFDEILAMMTPYLSDAERLSVAEFYDPQAIRAAIAPLMELNTRSSLARLVVLHGDFFSGTREVVEEAFAEAKLKGSPLFVKGPDGQPPLSDWMLQQTRYLRNWGEALGRKLLGMKTSLSFYLSGLGQTLVSSAGGEVSIQINPLSLLEGHPDGDSIVKGLILHEIGHHYWDIGQSGFKSMRGIAQSRNVREVFDILIDERLERAMRHFVPESKAWFDRLASFAFAQETHRVPLSAFADLKRAKDSAEAIRLHQELGMPGILVIGTDPPELELTTVEFFNLPVFDFPLMGFLNALRGGMSPDLFRDPRVGCALQLVPGNLRVLPHREVLKLAIKIGAELGMDNTPSGKSASNQRESLKQRLKELDGLLQSIIDRQAPFNRAALEGLAFRELAGTNSPAFKPDCDDSLPAPDLPEILPEGKGSRSKAGKSASGKYYNTDSGVEFERLVFEENLEKDTAAHEALFQSIAPHIRRMRAFLHQFVESEKESPRSLRGNRIDLAAVRKAALVPQSRLLIGHEQTADAGAYIGILIDNSASMEGEKSAMAKAFGMLIAEAAKGIREIEGHVNAFDGGTFIRLGDFREHSIASLDPGGGNNDAGAIDRAAELALASRKRHRIIIMINDDSPTASTVEAIKALIDDLTRRHGLVLTQIAVDELQTGAFPHFVDFSKLEFDAAVAEFGHLLRRLLRRS